MVKKNIIEWLQELDEPYRSSAISNTQEGKEVYLVNGLCWAVFDAFNWEDTIEGSDYWDELFTVLYNEGYETYVENNDTNCFYCKKEFGIIIQGSYFPLIKIRSYIICIDKGGFDNDFNTVSACQHCNGLKGDRSPLTFSGMLKKEIKNPCYTLGNILMPKDRLEIMLSSNKKLITIISIHKEQFFDLNRQYIEKQYKYTSKNETKPKPAVKLYFNKNETDFIIYQNNKHFLFGYLNTGIGYSLPIGSKVYYDSLNERFIVPYNNSTITYHINTLIDLIDKNKPLVKPEVIFNMYYYNNQPEPDFHYED